jgi:hypothetical protein
MPSLKCLKRWHKGFVVVGWFRGKDENLVCHEGCLKKQEMLRGNQEGLEAKVGSVQVDHFSNQHQ